VNLGGVRDWFRTRIDGIGYREWTDGFNFENIPGSILDRSYHLEVGTITTGAANQLHYTFSYPVTLRVFLKGYRNPSLAIDDALNQANVIYQDLLLPANRLQIDGLKDVRPVSVTPRSLKLTNDNAVILEMGFVGVLIYAF
jgi:hypothetical protein